MHEIESCNHAATLLTKKITSIASPRQHCSSQSGHFSSNATIYCLCYSTTLKQWRCLFRNTTVHISSVTYQGRIVPCTPFITARTDNFRYISIFMALMSCPDSPFSPQCKTRDHWTNRGRDVNIIFCGWYTPW